MRVTTDPFAKTALDVEVDCIRVHIDRRYYVDIEMTYDGRLRLRLAGATSRAFIVRPDCSNVVLIGDEPL